jgi:hypothetical protein
LDGIAVAELNSNKEMHRWNGEHVPSFANDSCGSTPARSVLVTKVEQRKKMDHRSPSAEQEDEEAGPKKIIRIGNDSHGPTSVAKDKRDQKEKRCFDHNKICTTEQPLVPPSVSNCTRSAPPPLSLSSVRTMSEGEEGETLATNKSWWFELEKCICTNSNIGSMLTMEEVERQVMHDYDKSQADLCYFIVFGYEENKHEAAQSILRGLHNSETDKNDDDSSRDGGSSHEPPAYMYNGAHMEEKGEGEKKKKQDVQEQNMEENEVKEVFKSMPVTVTVRPTPFPLPLLKKKICSLVSAVDSGKTFHSHVERQRGVTACLAWALCWTLALLCLCLLCLCVCFVPERVEGSFVMLQRRLHPVVKTVPLLNVLSMPVSVLSAPFLHQDDNTMLTHLDFVTPAPCVLLLPPIVHVSNRMVPSVFENVKKKVHGTFFLFIFIFVSILWLVADVSHCC